MKAFFQKIQVPLINVVLLIAVVVGLAGILLLLGKFAVEMKRGAFVEPTIRLNHDGCDFSKNDMTEDYSATFIAAKNTHDVFENIMKAFVDHKGTLSNRNEGQMGGNYIVNSYQFSGTMPVSESEAFMKEVTQLTQSPVRAENLSFSPTDSNQLKQTCLGSDTRLKSLRESEGLYLQSLARATANNSESSTFDSINNNLMNTRGNADSEWSTLTDLQRRLNKTSVNITVNDRTNSYSGMYPVNLPPPPSLTPSSTSEPGMETGI